jgi:hypothetical protein
VSVFATKEFARFARKAGLAAGPLLKAAQEVAAGHFDADLGGGVFKQRVARDGGGKSGGFRTLIVFKLGGHSFFVHGFAKNAKANVAPKELKALKALASLLNGLGPEALKKALAAGELVQLEAGADGVEGEAES